MLDVQAAWVFLYDAERGEFRLAADANLPAALIGEGKRRMAGDCRCNQMLRDGTLHEAINLIQCARLEQALPNNPESQQHATVPLLGQDGAVGILNLLLPRGRSFTNDELDMLGAIGHEIAVAIQRAQLFERVRAHEHVRRELLHRLLLVQEEERRRIAQDLHDSSGQLLTALTIRLDQLRGSPDRGAAVPPPELDAIQRLAGQVWDELRRLIHDLRPPVLDDLDLAAAARWFVETYVRPAGIRAEVQTEGPNQRLPADVETTAFRILQEAATSALRHAKTDRLEIRLNRKSGILHLMVRDFGVGFDPDTSEPGRQSLGLLGMGERAELVGGSVQVLSAPGLGTTVLARLPVPQEPPTVGPGGGMADPAVPPQFGHEIGW